MNESFDQARQFFLDGVAAFESGRLADAEQAFRASLQRLPGRPSTLSNLGATLLRLGRPEEAIEPLQQALAREPADAAAWYQLGLGHSRLRRPAQALTAYDRLLALQPGHAVGWLRRGQALQELDCPNDALQSIDRALALDAQLGEAWSHRGSLLKDAGRVDDAVQAFERAIELGADPELNRWFLAALDRGATPARAPRQYVEPLFDAYAETFDEHLVGALGYSVHRTLVEGLDRLDGGAGRRFAAALDLGCGTGLCAPHLKPRVDRLDGVDLSAAMLAKARRRGLYDRLDQGDLVEVLAATAARYDLVVAADVLIYLGDLDATCAGVRRVLRPGGVFAFSCELGAPEHDFEWQSSLRFAHSERYLDALAARHGLRPLRRERQPIRHDQGRPIPGLLAYLGG